MTYNKYKGFKMNSSRALRSICYECEKNMAINKTRCPFRSISNEFCKEYELIKKDLEIAQILKNSMSIETETFENDNNEVEEYEYIAFNNWDLDIENKEDYNKIKEWLKEK